MPYIKIDREVRHVDPGEWIQIDNPCRAEFLEDDDPRVHIQHLRNEVNWLRGRIEDLESKKK